MIPCCAPVYKGELLLHMKTIFFGLPLHCLLVSYTQSRAFRTFPIPLVIPTSWYLINTCCLSNVVYRWAAILPCCPCPQVLLSSTASHLTFLLAPLLVSLVLLLTSASLIIIHGVFVSSPPYFQRLCISAGGIVTDLPTTMDGHLHCLSRGLYARTLPLALLLMSGRPRVMHPE